MFEIINKNVYEVLEFGKIRNLKYSLNRVKVQDSTTQLNTLTQIPIIFQIFDLEAQQYVTDESINKTVDVYVNGELATTEDIVSGEGVIQFESAETGIFKIRVENYECEVVVNG